MPIRGHNPIRVDQFNGFYQRGRFDSIPQDHFSDTLNTQPSQGGWDSRDGFSQTVSAASVRRAYVYKVFGQADRLLFLDNSNQIWDSTNLSTPILIVTGMTDFGFENIYGRAYLSPSNGTTGLAGEKIYVYTGSGAAIAAAGLAPSGSALVATELAVAGNVEAGFRVYAIVYETNTGFLTPPGPATFATLTSTGSKKVTISNIPVGPANIAARRIVATKAIPSYNGNQTGYEFFFVPNGRINDNSTTTLVLSFFDADLLNDASYLLNLYTEIPAGVHLSNYHGRLVSFAEAANPSVVRVSYAGQPEAVDQVTGLLVIDPANTSSGVTNVQDMRDILYFFKKTRTYSTFDNGQTPAFWDVVTVDEGLGADINSVAVILDTGGVNTDKVFIANQLGLCIFNGQFVQPEVSWKIRDYWKRINTNAFNTVQVVQDSLSQRVYIAAPVDGATSPNEILVMDYANANLNVLSPFGLQTRWFRWRLANNVRPTTLVVETDPTTNVQKLRVGSLDGNIYDLVSGSTNDFGFAIPTPYVQTALLAEDDGMYSHCCGMTLRVIGSGVLVSTLYDYDQVNQSSFPNLTLSSTSATKPFVLNNFIAQRFIVKLQVNNVDEYFKLNSIELYIKPVYSMMPG